MAVLCFKLLQNYLEVMADVDMFIGAAFTIFLVPYFLNFVYNTIMAWYFFVRYIMIFVVYIFINCNLIKEQAK